MRGWWGVVGHWKMEQSARGDVVGEQKISGWMCRYQGGEEGVFCVYT